MAERPQLPTAPDTVKWYHHIMAAFHKQRMVYYERSHIEALFEAALPGCEIVWEKPKEQTRNKVWETWLITSVWKQRPGH